MRTHARSPTTQILEPGATEGLGETAFPRPSVSESHRVFLTRHVAVCLGHFRFELEDQMSAGGGQCLANLGQLGVPHIERAKRSCIGLRTSLLEESRSLTQGTLQVTSSRVVA